MQLDFRPHRNHADHGGRTAFGEHVKRLLRRLFEANGLEGVFDTSSRQVLDLGDGVALRRVDQVGGTADLGQFELARPRVNGDNTASPSNGGSLDGAQSNATT